ncbi:MAG: TerB family tellurite resistance protein [Woeseiaceae bacterium]
MHVIIGLLGGLLTIFYLLDRLGVDIGGLNPFYWYRRHAFAKKFGADPVYSIEDPVHIAALLVIGTAKLDGDITSGQKETALEQFATNFSIEPSEASGLFGSAAHLLAAPQLVGTQLEKLADRNGDRFSPDQVKSLIEMMRKVASADGQASGAQEDCIESIESRFGTRREQHGPWGT